VGQVSVLDRRVYVMSDVDRYLGLPGGTARRWIDGYSRGGRVYPPVIREDRSDDETVSWGEFVETRLLAGYRARGVSLQRLRPAVLLLRREFGTPYPLATAQLYLDVAGRELVMQVQDQTGLDRPLWLVVVRSGQLVLADPAQQFLDRAEFAGDGRTVTGLRTEVDTPDVRIDPLRQTGQPVVRSVPTAVLAEGFRAGDGVDTLADLYDLSTDQVLQAIRYEMRSAQGPRRRLTSASGAANPVVRRRERSRLRQTAGCLPRRCRLPGPSGSPGDPSRCPRRGVDADRRGTRLDRLPSRPPHPDPPRRGRNLHLRRPEGGLVRRP
jgi:uncharacterized protein (DUF433 family)